MKSFNMSRVKNIHLVGIGGCGMSAIARILFEMGYKISGSDVKEGPNTIRLKDLGVKIYIGHESAHIRNTDLLVYSSAVTEDNPERKEAEAKGIKSIKRGEMLAWIIAQSKNKIAVAGTHGKTTTTAMLVKVFEAAGLNPTFMIGCDMDYADGNAKLGKGIYAVTEADESDRSFLYLSPTVEVITNVEADHLEHFGGIEELVKTFEEFMQKLPPDGKLIMDGSDPNNKLLMKKSKNKVISYGLDPSFDYSARDFNFSHFNSNFILLKNGKEIGKVELSVPGRQNILNCCATFAVALEFGIDFSSIANALSTFVGARRRFSIVGEQQGIMIIDDYAHHPTEIRATLSAARAGWPGRRIICVFQPHRYTRTLFLKDDFALAFGDADKTIIADIYAASEAPIPGVSGKTIADLLDPSRTSYIPKKEQITEKLISEIKEGDMILTLGAGDIYTVGKELFSRLKMKA